jgi:hypothetical protein
MNLIGYLIGTLDGDSAQRKASTYTGQHNTEKGGHTSMPRTGFEPPIPVFARSKTIRALDRVDIKLAETNNKNKNIRDLYRGIKEFKKGYQSRINIKDENG